MFSIFFATPSKISILNVFYIVSYNCKLFVNKSDMTIIFIGILNRNNEWFGKVHINNEVMTRNKLVFLNNTSFRSVEKLSKH